MTGNDTALDGTRTPTLREKADAGVVLHCRLDPTEHARRRQAGAAPLTRVDHLDDLYHAITEGQ